MIGIGIAIPGQTAAHSTDWVPTALPGCVLWLRADLGITLGGTLKATGTTPPAATISGTPNGLYGLHIEIDNAGGARGTATFKWSLDNGATYQATGVLTAATTVLGTTGITVAWPVATYNADNKYDATVSQWNDQSGQGNHAAQVTAALQPTLVKAGINGRPSLSFIGSASNGLSTPGASLGAFSILLLVKLSGAPGYLFTHKANTVDGAYLYGDISNTTTVLRGSIGSAWNITTNWAVDNVARSILMTYDGTHAGHNIYFGGVQQAMTNVSASNPGTASVSGPIFLATTQSGTVPSTGLYEEVAVWNRALSAAEIARVSAYTRAIEGA